MELNVFRITLAASVQRYEETSAAAFHRECYLIVVAQHDRAHVQAVGRDRREADSVALRHYDRSAHAERVSRAARRRAYDETIGLVCGEALIIHVSVYSYHR